MDEYTLFFILGRTVLCLIVGVIATALLALAALVIRRLVGSQIPVRDLLAKVGFYTAGIVFVLGATSVAVGL